MMNEAVALSDAPIATNQVEFPPLSRPVEASGSGASERHFADRLLPDGRCKVPKDAVLADIGARHKKSAAQVALRWAVQQKDVIALSKTANVGPLQENFDVFDFELSERTWRKSSSCQAGWPHCEPRPSAPAPLGLMG